MVHECLSDILRELCLPFFNTVVPFLFGLFEIFLDFLYLRSRLILILVKTPIVFSNILTNGMLLKTRFLHFLKRFFHTFHLLQMLLFHGLIRELMILPKYSDLLSVRNGVFPTINLWLVLINHLNLNLFIFELFLDYSFLDGLNLRRRLLIALTDETIKALFYLFFYERKAVSGRHIRRLNFVPPLIWDLSVRDCFPFGFLLATQVDHVYFIQIFGLTRNNRDLWLNIRFTWPWDRML